MGDDAEHVVDVGVAVLLFEDHAKHLLGLLELPLGIVLAAEDEELLHTLIQGSLRTGPSPKSAPVSEQRTRVRTNITSLFVLVATKSPIVFASPPIGGYGPRASRG